jgi:hypothetical protein
MGEDVLQALARSTILGRTAVPAEIADAVVFLASPSAGYITGAILDVYGGQRPSTDDSSAVGCRGWSEPRTNSWSLPMARHVTPCTEGKLRSAWTRAT